MLTSLFSLGFWQNAEDETMTMLSDALLLVDVVSERLTRSGMFPSTPSMGSAAVSPWMDPNQVWTSHGLKLSTPCIKI